MPFLKKPRRKLKSQCNDGNNEETEKPIPRSFVTMKIGNNLIYDGNYKNSMRHGFGSTRRLEPSGQFVRVYVGQWENNVKMVRDSNSLKMLSILECGGIIFGMVSAFYGIITVKCIWVNRNAIVTMHMVYYLRYEGTFKFGKKHGEGTYYHLKTGQVQKGMWEEDICRTSIIQDELRHNVLWPTEYPLPKIELQQINKLIRTLFRRYMPGIRAREILFA